METLLTIAVIVTAVAIVVQAGVLLGMYLNARRLTNEVNGLIHESRRLMTPLESVAVNFKSTSKDLAEISKLTREEAQRLEEFITGTVEETRKTVLRPVREGSAIARGITEGMRVLFRGKQRAQEETIRKFPAA